MPQQEARQLLRVLARHDRATVLHSGRVRRYALWLADEYGLPADQRERLNLAARLHDVGKLHVPAAVLNKPGRLTDDEYRQVQTHAAIGAEFIERLTPCLIVRAAVRSHHERFDGFGYPDGLGGTDIPLLARLLAVADAFDAMTGYRPYSQPLDRRAALQVLWGEAGRQFDPDVVACFALAAGRPR